MEVVVLGLHVKEIQMSFEKLQTEINVLLAQMENQPQDMHELHRQVHEKINEMRAFGMPIPQDFIELEQKLDAQIA